MLCFSFDIMFAKLYPKVTYPNYRSKTIFHAKTIIKLLYEQQIQPIVFSFRFALLVDSVRIQITWKFFNLFFLCFINLQELNLVMESFLQTKSQCIISFYSFWATIWANWLQLWSLFVKLPSSWRENCCKNIECNF